MLNKLNINIMGIVSLKRFWHKASIAAICLLLNAVAGFANKIIVYQQSVEINGKVTDATGKPLVDVTVKNETKSSAVNTDIEGDYFIDAEKGNVLSFSVTGFDVKSMVVADDKVINIVLQESVSIPTEFNVLYAQKKKSTNVAAVSEIYTNDLEKTIVSPVYGTFTGRLAGLLTAQSNGEPGNDGYSLSLRGQEPLVLLDGVAQSFSSINPEQIESVTVLKDALATAMLGIRGANGAILITSKKGHVGPQTISFKALGGISQPTYLPKTLDAYNYSLLFNEALANDGRPAAYSAEALEAYRTGSDPIRYPNVNWQDELLKNRAAYSRYNLEIAGGRTSARYFVSMDYLNQPGLFKNNDDAIYNTNSSYKRYILRSNVQVDLSKSITTTLGLIGRIQDSNEPGATTASLYSNIINTPANAYPIYNSDGSYAASQNYRYNVYAQNYESGYRPGQTRDFRIDLSIKGKLDAIAKGLWIKTSGTINSYLVQSINRSKTVPLFMENIGADGSRSYFPFNNPGDQANSASTDSQNRVFYTELAVGYSTSINKNNFEGQVIANNDFRHINRDLPYNIKGISAKGSYNYDEKYIAEVALAYNGTEERYPSGKGFGFFPAAGLGYVISKEDFLSDINWLNTLKLRTSFGRVGNFTASYYGYNQYYNTTGGYNFGDVPGAAGGIAQNTIANTRLTWEKADKFNLGIDASLLNNKLYLTAEYFNNKYFDQLQSIGNNTAITGVGYANQNIGISRYSGLEFDVNYRNQVKNINYFISPNLTILKTKVVYQDEFARQYSYQMRTGMPVGQRFGYVAEGLFQTETEIQNSPTPADFGIRPGDIRYRDLNNDGIINVDDQTAIGSTKPSVYYGVNLGFSWKNLDFSALVQGSHNNDVYLNGSSMWAFQGVQGQAFEHHLNRWTPATSATATYPRLSVGNNLNNDAVSTYWVKSGDYLRLKSIELGYKLPIALVKKVRLSGVRVFVNGTNLLTFSGLDNMDAENYNASYPIQKMLNAGVNVKF
jgi:TonB-linked SusC/RagA family outer membrane protein